MKQILLLGWLVAGLLACAPAASAQSGACQSGYIWREATPADHVCVAPSARAQAAADNAAASSHTRADGDACMNGYVWREATTADHVCVTPQSRAQALADNRLAASRVASASSPMSAPSAINATPPMLHAPAGAASPPAMAGFKPRPPVGPPTAPPPGSGPCPNASQWAFDPVANQCVALQTCQGDLIWNPDRNACVPRPPGGGLECLKGWRFSIQDNKCIPPNCAAPLVFNTAKNECAPRAPCPTGFTFNQQHICVPETYGILEFTIGTGSDDLRTNSLAWALINLPGGGVQICNLKAFGEDSWSSNSRHSVVCILNNNAMTFEFLRKTAVTIQYNGHYSVGQNQDNWNLESVKISAYNQGERPICIFSTSGDPIHRFKGVTVSNIVDAADDSVVITELPNNCL